MILYPCFLIYLLSVIPFFKVSHPLLSLHHNYDLYREMELTGLRDGYEKKPTGWSLRHLITSPRPAEGNWAVCPSCWLTEEESGKVRGCYT